MKKDVSVTDISNPDEKAPENNEVQYSPCSVWVILVLNQGLEGH